MATLSCSQSVLICINTFCISDTGQRGLCGVVRPNENEALSSGEPKPIISNVARGPKARGQHWKLLAEGHHLINSL